MKFSKLDRKVSLDIRCAGDAILLWSQYQPLNCSRLQVEDVVGFSGMNNFG